MTMLVNPVVLRMAMLMFVAIAAFGVGLFTIRHMRKSLVEDSASFDRAPLLPEGMPVHAYHAVIQDLKQQKSQLAAQQLSERRKAKASETLSSTILSSLSCGVLFFNTNGLVRQANSVARNLLGFASPVGLSVSDLFRTAAPRPQSAGVPVSSNIEDALAPALAGTATVRGLVVNFVTRESASEILEITASPVLADDGRLMGTTLVLTDRTDIERIRHDQRTHEEMSAELAYGLRTSLSAIKASVQQLADSRDPQLVQQLADGITHEAAQLDRTIGSFLGGARAATTSS